jgi:hypothetical protein
VSQTTRRRVRDQINLLRDKPQLPFGDLLEAQAVNAALQGENVSFRHCIFTPLVTLWTFLSQVLSQDHSCREAVDRLIAFLVARGEKPCAPETSTYCEARQRIPLGVITRLTRKSHDDLETSVPRDWTWRGRHCCLVDGSAVSMPDTEENQRAFPQPDSQKPGVGFPIARIVALISLATGAVRDLAIGRYQGKESGEPALFRTLFDRLKAGDIMLGDRYFAGYFTIALLGQRGVDVVFRMHHLREYDFRRGRRLGVLDHVVRWSKPQRPDWMQQELYDQLPDHLVVRELKIHVQVPGFRVDELVLATTLLDPAEYAKEEVADLFLSRWSVELDIRSIKCEMQMDILRCKTPDMVEKELWMHMLAYNLIRGLIAATAEAHDKLPRRISFKGALQALATFADSLRLTRGRTRAALVEELLRTIAAQDVGNRPGRIEPRALKRRPKSQKYLTEPRHEARKRLLHAA